MPDASDFPDYFSSIASNYAAARPSYPVELFEFVANKAPSNDRVWDCATGSGQAALGLSKYFTEVHATDASAQQIHNAARASNISYSVQFAEKTKFPAQYFDAVTVAQALHWFRLDEFSAELARVLRPKGLIAVGVYGFFKVTPEIDACFNESVQSEIRHLWKPGNWMAKSGYSDVDLPFERLDVPVIEMSCDWSLGQLLRYVSTWSAVNRYVEENGGAILDRAANELASVWGDRNLIRKVVMDFAVHAWRHDVGT